ncbi:MAG: hypothetical protein FRX49_10522 [Trebouxia sp. A1-2]|nr:MAG: hypothetical protein FRX49_10522 [Trebouxia sp. A1-2]
MAFCCLRKQQQLCTVDTRQADAHSTLLLTLYSHMVTKGCSPGFRAIGSNLDRSGLSRSAARPSVRPSAKPVAIFVRGCSGDGVASLPGGRGHPPVPQLPLQLLGPHQTQFQPHQSAVSHADVCTYLALSSEPMLTTTWSLSCGPSLGGEFAPSWGAEEVESAGEPASREMFEPKDPLRSSHVFTTQTKASHWTKNVQEIAGKEIIIASKEAKVGGQGLHLCLGQPPPPYLDPKGQPWQEAQMLLKHSQVHDVKSYLAKAGHGFHTGTAGIHNDGQQQRQAHSNADTADPADGHVQCTCKKGTLHDVCTSLS